MSDSSPNFRQPHWWTDAHNAAWDHVREAFRNKWEENRPEQPARGWDEVEPAIRFGFGWRRRPPESEQAKPAPDEEWDPELEARLEQDWDSMHKTDEEPREPHLWHDVRQFVHRGWVGP